MLRPVVFAALISCCALAAQADVYRWVDQAGQSHYSDQWVPGSTVVRTDKPRPADISASASQTPSLNAINKAADAQLTKEDNTRAMQQDKQKRQDALCKTSKDAYMRAITSRRVFKPAADGTQNFLTDDEADAYRAQLRKTVQDNCGSVPSFDPEAPIPEPQPIPEPKVNPADATSR
jgi:predicted NAD/FAD-dependent oxidoreductase